MYVFSVLFDIILGKPVVNAWFYKLIMQGGFFSSSIVLFPLLP